MFLGYKNIMIHSEFTSLNMLFLFMRNRSNMIMFYNWIIFMYFTFNFLIFLRVKHDLDQKTGLNLEGKCYVSCIMRKRDFFL